MSTQIDRATCEGLSSLHDELSIVVRERLVDFLGFESIDDIGPKDAFADLGTDSRQAVEFKILLEEMLGCKLRTTILFEHPTIDRLVDFLCTQVDLPTSRRDFPKKPAIGSTATFPSIASSRSKSRYRLSETQRGLWFVGESLANPTSFNVPLLFQLSKPLNAECFNLAIQTIASRHPAIRTKFIFEPDSRSLVQEVVEATEIRRVENLTITSQTSIRDRLVEKLRTPFDLTVEPPIQSFYGVDEQEKPFVLVVFHHIMMDGLSAVPIAAELWSCYAEHLSQLSNGPVLVGLESSSVLDDARSERGFFEYLDWEEAYLESDACRRSEVYWAEKLRNCRQDLGIPSLNIPLNAAGKRSGVACVSRSLSRKTADRLIAASRRLNAPISTILLATFFLFLRRLTDREDQCITTPVSGRPGGQRGHFRDAVGCFINLIVTRCNVDEDQSFHSLVELVRQEFLDGMEHGQVPFGRQLLVSGNRLAEGTRSRFPISFTYQNIFESWQANSTPSSIATLDFSLYQEIDDDLTLEVYDFQDQFQINWKYQASLYPDEAVQAWSESFEHLLEQALESPDRQMAQMTMLTSSQLCELFANFDRRDEPISQAGTVVDLIERNLASRPDSLAIIHSKSTWTYRQLCTASREYSDELVSQGIGPGSLVRVMVRRDPETIVKILGILRCGAAYFPVDPLAPPERTAMMIEDAGDRVTEGTAYVLFTSGTTGRPKGVPIRHAALINLSLAMVDCYGLTEQDRVLQFASLTFDMSVEEIFPVLCAGGAVVMREEDDIEPRRLAKTISTHGVTLLNLPPSYHLALGTLGDEKRRELYRSVRIVAFGGDELPLSTLKDVQASGTRVFNAYGPTEATVNVTVCELTDAKQVTLGVPLPGLGLFLCDSRQRLLPPYAAGELCIAGIGLSDGYLGDTADSRKFTGFFHDDASSDTPFGRRGKIYRTGDLACLLGNNRLMLLGRSDDQISLRGNRIEPGEIESVVRSLPGIHDCVVVSANEQLVAFYVASPEATEVTRRKQWLTEMLESRLPAIMLPSRWIELENIPINERRKIDRKVLRALAEESVACEQRDESGSEQEILDSLSNPLRESWSRVRALLCELLGTPHLRIGDNFMDVGGHSLLAIQAVSLLNQCFATDLTLRQFLACEDFADLTRLLSMFRPSQEDGFPSPSSNRDLIVAAHRKRGPLSPSQARLWFLDRLGGGNAYILPSVVEVEGPLNVGRLRAAIEQIVHRHEILRTNFVEEAGIPSQIVHDSNSIPFDCQSFASRTSALEWIREQIDIPFDIARDTLIRIAVAELDAERSLLLVNMHHIVSDGWSMRLFLDELEVFYSQPDDDKTIVPPLAIQYLDFAENQFHQEPDAKGITFWEGCLADFEETQLDTDFVRPSVLSGQGELITRAIPSRLNLGIRELCKKLRVVPSTFWLGVLFVLLRKRGAGNDLCIGMPVAGRSNPQLASLIGFFVNTVVVRLRERERSHKTESIAEFLRHIGNIVADSLEHQSVRIEDVLAKIRPERRLSQSPIFQVLFNYAAVPVSNLRLGDCTLNPVWLHNATAKFELTFSISEMSDSSSILAVEYATDLFTETTATQILDQFQYLAEQLVFDSEFAIDSLRLRPDLPSDGESKPPPSPIPFAEAFELQVASRPHAIAIESGEGNFTYSGLFSHASDFEIAQSNVGVVEIAPQRGIDLICQCVAALKAKKPFVFDHAFASAHLSEDTAYVLPTSGSTGIAKGVAISRLSMDTHNVGFETTFQIEPSDRIAQYASPHFDLFIEEVFPALRCGATIVVVPDEIRLDIPQLARWVHEKRLTILDLPTSVFHALVQYSDDCRRWLSELRLVIVGGEKLSSDAVASFTANCPSVALWNTYGPTEATIICTATRCDPFADQHEVPIGQSFANADLIVVDPDGKEVPSGVVGELVIGGPGVAQGYVVEGEIVQRDSFRAHPAQPNQVAYWTGDRVKVSSKGELHFLGRFDDQVKIRGQRINPEEVATWIARDSRVEEVAVVSNRNGDETYLIAAVKTYSAIEVLRRDLMVSMPAAMRPSVWLPMETIPISSRGKVDRRQILRLAQLAERAIPDEASFQTETQRRLRKIWCGLISHSSFSIDDSFFDVGGHSLLATQLVHQIEGSFGVRLPLVDVFRMPTIRMLAERMETTVESSRVSSLATYLPCKDSTIQAVMVIMPGLPGLGEMYYSLAQNLQENFNVILLSMPGFQGDEPSRSLDETAERWHRLIQELNDSFPTTVIAHSYSGSILTRILDIYGAPSLNIQRVVLVDCWPHDRVAMKFHDEFSDRLDSLPTSMQSEITRVLEASLAAEPLRVHATVDLCIDLVIADSSRGWLNANIWESYFRQVAVFYCSGDHFSIVRPPGYRMWLEGLNMMGQFEKGMKDV